MINPQASFLSDNSIADFLDNPGYRIDAQLFKTATDFTVLTALIPAGDAIIAGVCHNAVSFTFWSPRNRR
jgi:hypothetical protein